MPLCRAAVQPWPLPLCCGRTHPGFSERPSQHVPASLFRCCWLADSEGFTVLHYCCMLRARMGGDPGDACDAEDCRHSQCIRALLSQGWVGGAVGGEGTP